MSHTLRENIYCLSQIALESEIPIQVTTTESIAKEYDLLQGGMFGVAQHTDLDQLFAESGRYVDQTDNIIATQHDVGEALDEVSHATDNLDNPSFTVEDAQPFDEVMTLFNVDMESIKDSVYDFYRKVKAFLINLWRKLVRLTDIMYRNVTTLKREAEQLNRRCSEVGYSGSVGGLFTAPSVVIVSYLGKANITSVVNGLLETARVYEEAVQKSTDAASAYYPKLNEIVSAVSKQSTTPDMITAAFSVLETLSSKFDYESAPISGGYVYAGYAELSQKGFNAGFKIKRVEQYYHGIEPNVPIPTVKEIQLLCTNVIKLCDKLTWGRARLRTIRTAHNAALDNIDTLVHKLHRGGVVSVIKTDSLVSRLTRLVNDSITGSIHQLNTTVYRAATGSLLYAQRGLTMIENKA